MKIIKLQKEYTFNGNKTNEITLRHEEMSAKEYLECEKEFKSRQNDAFFKEIEDGYALVVAGKASGIRYHELLNLIGVDYLKVVGTIKTFLTKSWGSEEKEQEKTEETPAEIIVNESLMV